jgi:predicted deacylase
VSTGRLLGRVTDPFGAVLHEARAPFAGEVVYVVATPPVNPGEPLCEIGQVAETSGVA